MPERYVEQKDLNNQRTLISNQRLLNPVNNVAHGRTVEWMNLKLLKTLHDIVKHVYDLLLHSK